MKNINYKHTILLIVAVFFISINAMGQVGIGTTTPETSSMLEVKSTTKGMLIPRMTTAQRIAISSPATGLLVFDLTTETFWFYTTAWEELVAGSSGGNELVDADGDTKIEVEQSADEDKIRFSTGSNPGNVTMERMTIDNAGNTRIGDGTNNTYIEADGSLSYEGSATRFEDLTIPVTSTKTGGTKDPDFAKFTDNGSSSQGVFIFWFDNGTEEELYFTVQIPHGRKYNTEIFPHVHWAAEGDLSGNVVWGLEYNWANIGDVLGNTEIIYGSSDDSLVGSPATAKKHVLTAFTGNGVSGGIDGTGKELSSMLLCRVFRAVGHADDTYTGDAGILQIDFHIEYDADGSRELYIK